MTDLTSPTPSVSIVIPVYNAAHFLPAALDSILAQTFQDFEIILVDDGSTDDLTSALEPYKNVVRLLHQQNAGPSTARNRGIRAARGEFVAFLDSDDLWEPEKLELQMGVLRENPDVGACFTECVYFDENETRPADLWKRVPEPEKIFEALLTSHFIPLSTLIVRRSCLDAVGLFDEGLIGSEDYNLYLRLARRYGFRFLPQPLLKSRFHPGNLSNDLEQMCHDEIANLDKISAMFPDLKLPKRSMIGQIWFRFGQYHFDGGDFAKARRCFWHAIVCTPTRTSAYAHWLAAVLPPQTREVARSLVRKIRGTQPVPELGKTPETSTSTDAAPPQETPARPQRVMMVTWSFVAGGSETYALTLARHLDRSKFEPLMCALDQGGALESEIKRLGIPCYVMHRKPGVQIGLMWRMFRLFRRKRIRVVHTHHFNQLFYSFLGAKLCGARIIHTEHSIESYKRPHLCKALNLLARGCHKIVAIGEDGAKVLRENVGIPESKLQIVRAGIDLEAFSQNREDARREMGLATDMPVAAIVARLSSEKNHKGLLEAWSQVVKTIPNAVLLVAGGGPEEDALKAQIEKLGLQSSVQMLGVRRDVARILAASDVFVLCSDREGLPLVILEAMAAARPVVATAVGDLPRVVREGETGLLVPPKQPDALAQALIDSLQQRERGIRFGEAGRQAVQGFGLKPMIETHQELYGAPAQSGTPTTTHTGDES